jgi:hypothetical protein
VLWISFSGELRQGIILWSLVEDVYYCNSNIMLGVGPFLSSLSKIDTTHRELIIIFLSHRMQIDYDQVGIGSFYSIY